MIEVLNSNKGGGDPVNKRWAADPYSPIHNEIHEKAVVLVNKEVVELARKEILERYNILEQNCIILPIPKKPAFMRVARCFIIVKDKNKNYYYVEGNTDHAVLVQQLIDKFKIFSEKNGVDNNQIKIKKGVIDSSGKGFENLPQTKKELERLNSSNKEVKNINWVLTYEYPASE